VAGPRFLGGRLQTSSVGVELHRPASVSGEPSCPMGPLAALDRTLRENAGAGPLMLL